MRVQEWDAGGGGGVSGAKYLEERGSPALLMGMVLEGGKGGEWDAGVGGR